MKKINKKIIFIILILAMIICAGSLILFSKKDIVEENSQIIKSERIGEISLVADKLVKVGQEFQVDINFDSFKSNIVLVASEINFDCQNIELVKINSKKDLSLDIFEQNSVGKIYIVRGEPGDADFKDTDDGYTGSGSLATLIFRAVATGSCQLNLNSENSQMVLDDGKGTYMSLNLNDAIININN